jgi:hypothetical protein
MTFFETVCTPRELGLDVARSHVESWPSDAGASSLFHDALNVTLWAILCGKHVAWQVQLESILDVIVRCWHLNPKRIGSALLYRTLGIIGAFSRLLEFRNLATGGYRKRKELWRICRSWDEQWATVLFTDVRKDAASAAQDVFDFLCFQMNCFLGCKDHSTEWHGIYYINMGKHDYIGRAQLLRSQKAGHGRAARLTVGMVDRFYEHLSALCKHWRGNPGEHERRTRYKRLLGGCWSMSLGLIVTAQASGTWVDAQARESYSCRMTRPSCNNMYYTPGAIPKRRHSGRSCLQSRPRLRATQKAKDRERRELLVGLPIVKEIEQSRMVKAIKRRVEALRHRKDITFHLRKQLHGPLLPLYRIAQGLHFHRSGGACGPVDIFRPPFLWTGLGFLAKRQSLDAWFHMFTVREWKLDMIYSLFSLCEFFGTKQLRAAFKGSLLGFARHCKIPIQTVIVMRVATPSWVHYVTSWLRRAIGIWAHVAPAWANYCLEKTFVVTTAPQKWIYKLENVQAFLSTFELASLSHLSEDDFAEVSSGADMVRLHYDARQSKKIDHEEMAAKQREQCYEWLQSCGLPTWAIGQLKPLVLPSAVRKFGMGEQAA